MTQFDYDVICNCLTRGVPVLAENLIVALNNVLNDNKRLQTKLSELEAKQNPSKAAQNKETK